MTSASADDLMNQFSRLVEDDAQLKYALNAVRRYKSSDAPVVEEERKNRHKRNIVSVDDNLKINYEMIKSTPGSFLDSAASSKPKAQKEQLNRITKLKTNCYKKRLYNMNEQFVQEHGQIEPLENTLEANKSDATLQQQVEWLSQIHQNLLRDYKQLLQEEKRWFIKKELMLETNLKLDLFSTKGEDRISIYFGSKDSGSLCFFN
ncbi:LAMI_0G08548g1_1 [Lachancea mirantina]|uniref:LAMI_0G08548g1_1 n=1 Tax=Lachancea mirantina TaxID=1230905 RepID=A0A1G4KA13_9SACH|nr:LAMI_0G08548g1_1 [Lachancea mirantina]